MKKKIFRFLAILIFGVLCFFIGTYYQNNSAEISTKDLTASAKLFGIDYTQKEKDSALKYVKRLRTNFENNRKKELPNSVWPSLQFNPIPQGFEFKTKQGINNFSSYTGTKLPENMNDLAFYSVGQLGELIKTKQISSVDLTEFFLDRLQKYDPMLKCVVSLTENLAIHQAEKADEEIAAGNYRGPLHGIPFGVKDLLAAKNYKTTWGAMPYKDQVINEDATVVKKLEAAGAVLCAKLTLGALANGDVWFGGKTRNPWDTLVGSSGSSAGPASAVSGGLLPFAIGSETWGSIVSPSTRCGTTGLRPSYGRVSRTGAMTLSWSMDKLGPICRTVEDCALVFDVIYGDDGQDPTLYDLPFNYNHKVDFSKVKIGYFENAFEKDTAMKTFYDETLKIMEELGAELIPIELPDFDVFDISFILKTEASAAFEELTLSGRDDLLVRQDRHAWANIFRYARYVPAVDYIQANRQRYLIVQEMESILKEVDVYIAPSFGKNLLLTNLTGHPCVVMPNGFKSPSQPISITFNGKLFDEGLLMAVAKAYQDATIHHLKHPVID